MQDHLQPCSGTPLLGHRIPNAYLAPSAPALGKEQVHQSSL